MPKYPTVSENYQRILNSRLIKRNIHRQYYDDAAI